MTLYEVARKNDLKEAKKLLENGENTEEPRSKRNWTPLMIACENGHTDMVKLLLKSGANVNAENKFKATPLHISIGHEHHAIVKILLKSGADPSISSSVATTREYVKPGDHQMTLLLMKYAHLLGRKDKQMLKEKTYKVKFEKIQMAEG